jgi:hypothetical protein
LSSVFLLVIGAVIVAAIAFLLRKAGGGSVDAPVTPEGGGNTADAANDTEVVDEQDDDDEDADPGYIAVSSDDLAFVPRRHGVLITPAHEVRQELVRQRRRQAGASEELPPPVFPAEPEAEQRARIVLQPGDLIATRVVQGAPYIDPWRLETLGRDRDLSEWAFETEDAAHAAQQTLERLVVRPPFDAEGEPVTVGDEDFWVAEQERMRTLAEFDAPDEPEEEPRR